MKASVSKIRYIAVLLALLIAAGAVSLCFAAEDEYTYDTRFAGFLGRGLVHDEKFAGCEIHYGIDVSAYQKEVNWKTVADAGTEFVFIRVGYRGYGTGKIVEDEYAEANVEGALAQGLKVGVYFFSQAITVEEGLEEADFVCAFIDRLGLGPANILLPVVYDVEYPYSEGKPVGRLYEADLSLDERTSIALAFLNRAEKNGYRACLYGSRSALNSDGKGRMSEINGRYPVWLAAYTTSKKASYSGPYEFWQYSSYGKVPGIEGEVDLDVWYLDASSVSGWTEKDGSVYYIDPDTKAPLTGWQTIASKTYCFDQSGRMLTHWQDIDQKHCYFGRNGILRSGWEDIDGQRYFFSQDGDMLTHWQEISGNRYYFGTDGAMRKGLVSVDEELYFFSEEGSMLTGWQEIEGSYYCFAENGAALKGKQSTAGISCSFSEDGKLESGIIPAFVSAEGGSEPGRALIIVFKGRPLIIHL